MKKNKNLNSPGTGENLRPEDFNPKKRIKKVDEKLVFTGYRGNFFVIQSIPGMEEKDIITEIEVTMRILEEFTKRSGELKKSTK